MQTFTKEFKLEAVHLVQTSAKPMTQIAQGLGIANSTLHHWRQQLTEHGTQAFPGSGHQLPQDKELRRLKQKLEITRQERDIFKKPISIFSRGQP